MRSEAAEREWQRWKRESAGIGIAREIARKVCEESLKVDPGWVPKGQFLWYLRSLDIDDEYVKITPHSFVTVRFQQSSNIKEVYDKVLNLKYTWLEGAEAVLEGFSTHNPHMHILIPRKMHKGNLIKQLANRFKLQKHLVDFKQSDSPEVFATRQSYIRGTKQQDKTSKVEADVEIRNANNIPHLINF